LGGSSALVPVLDFILYYVYIFISFFFSVSPCDSITCLNGGTCVVDSGFAICFCRGDYTGSTCSGKTHYYLYSSDLKVMQGYYFIKIGNLSTYRISQVSKTFFLEITDIWLLKQVTTMLGK